MIKITKTIKVGHPLDDDGFVEHAINELTKVTKKWNLVIESDESGNVCLVFRDEMWKIEEIYTFRYDYKKQKYV